MVSTVASAQAYVNLEYKDGTVRSYSTEKVKKVSFGEKEEADPTSINGHPCVKLAGYYWATENIGKSAVPAIAGPDAKDNNWMVYYYTLSEDNAMSAIKLWGHEGSHDWTLPNQSQWNALLDNCYWEWTDSYSLSSSPYNGKPGYIVYEAKKNDDKGKKDIENSGYTLTDSHIFLPAAGFYKKNMYSNEVAFQGEQGIYCLENNRDECLLIYRGNKSISHHNTTDGIAVRPVSE